MVEASEGRIRVDGFGEILLRDLGVSCGRYVLVCRCEVSVNEIDRSKPIVYRSCCEWV